MPTRTPIAEYDDGEIEELDDGEIIGMVCEKCGHEWENSKHPAEMNRPACPNSDCRTQSKQNVCIITEGDEPESQPLGGPAVNMNDTGPDGWTAEPPQRSTGVPAGVSAGETDNDDKADFTTMDRGEFIKWFFENNGFGVKEDFANSLARQCELREELPDEQTMTYMLQSHNSGIGNANDAQMLSEAYWSVAQRYLNARGEMGGQPQPMLGGGGGWVGGDMQGGNGTQPGGWVDAPDAQTDGAGMGHSGGGPRPGGWVSAEQPGQQNQQPTPGGGSHGAMNGPGGGVNPAVQQILQQMQRQQEQMMEFMREQSQSRNQSNPQPPEDNTLTDQLDELAAAMKTVESLRDDDDTSNEALQQMQQQINQLAKGLSEQAQQQPQVEGNGMEAVFAQLATRDDVDTETLTALAGQFGVEADPEVKKAELEMEKELKKTERYGDIVNTIFDNAGDAMADALPAAVNAALSDNTVGPNEGETGGEPIGEQVEVAAEQAQGQPQHQGQQPQAQAQPQADAGGQQAAQQQAGQPETQQSPAAQRFGSGEVELAEDAIRDDPDDESDADTGGDTDADAGEADPDDADGEE